MRAIFLMNIVIPAYLYTTHIAKNVTDVVGMQLVTVTVNHRVFTTDANFITYKHSLALP